MIECLPLSALRLLSSSLRAPPSVAASLGAPHRRLVQYSRFRNFRKIRVSGTAELRICQSSGDREEHGPYPWLWFCSRRGPLLGRLRGKYDRFLTPPVLHVAER